MSYVFPCPNALNGERTQPIDITVLLSGIEKWAQNANAGINGAPTYKSNNNTAAYFKFLKIQDRKLVDSKANQFQSNPDQPMFKDLRKYMIILANILLSEFNDNIKIGAKLVNYSEICRSDNQLELQVAFEKWAKEIDSKNYSQFTEIYAVIGNQEYPIAFYSDDPNSMRIYPHNTIHPDVCRNLFGYNGNEYTMDKLGRDLIKIPIGARILYSSLKNTKACFSLINSVREFSIWLGKWLNRNLGIDVNTSPFTPNSEPIVFMVDDTTRQLNLPIYPSPYGVGTNDVPVFSERLLIIKSNKNVEDGKYGFCKIDNTSIGEKGEAKYAVIPPISPELIAVLRDNCDNVKFLNCNIEKKAGGSFEASMRLSIDGAECNYSHVYSAGDVDRCANFPLVTILTKTNTQPLPAQLYRCNYPVTDNQIPRSYLNGSDVNFELGLSEHFNSDNFELDFRKNVPATDGVFTYFGVRYHETATGKTISYGYLFFDLDHSIYNAAQNASPTAVIIDDANNVSKISVWDSVTENIESYEVYSDKLLFFNKNNRSDFNTAGDKVWGILNSTVFSVENDTKYALAPFSLEFSNMLASGHITIANANFKLLGNKWHFSVNFSYNGGNTQQTPAKIYEPENQYLCPNPPFIYAVDTIDAIDASPGYDVVLVQNMKPNHGARTEQKILDSNDLTFKIDGKSLSSNQFVAKKVGTDNQRVYIQIFGGIDNSTYYGQIGLPLEKYKWNQGFALKDDSTNCAAVLLVNNHGENQPKEIITGRVFDDNLFFIAKENSRAGNLEYCAWRKSELFIDIQGMPAADRNGREYQAIFPFSLKMLQNIKDGNLTLSQMFKPQVKYDPEQKCYNVSVFINNNGANVEFKMTYYEDKIVKINNLPFVVPLEHNRQKLLVRFDNELTAPPVPHTDDGSLISIEYIEENTVGGKLSFVSIPRSTINESKTIEVSSDTIILKLSTSGKVCHLIYEMEQAFSDGVYAMQSEITGTQHIFDFCDGNVKRIQVFTEYMMWTSIETSTGKFANDTDCIDLTSGSKTDKRIYSIPITMAFSELMEKRGLSIADYSAHVKYYTDSNQPDKGILDVNMSDGLYVDISLTGLMGVNSKISKKYSKEKILPFDEYPLPTLTVFPFVNFIADASYEQLEGKSLWQEYSYAKFTLEEQTPNAVGKRELPLGSRVEFWINGQRVNFQKRSTLVMEAAKEKRKRMEIAKVNGWGTYIHMKYDGSNQFAPSQPVDGEWNGQELGCIIMKPAEPTIVAANQEATVGVDFGTRNSMIAIRTMTKTGFTFPYHGRIELQKIIIPGMSEEDFYDFSNLSYIPHFDARGIMKAGEGKFSSTVMLYSDAQKQSNIPLTPYDWGFVPNVQGDVLKRIMSGLGEQGSMGDVLGFYSDLKISTNEGDINHENIMKRNVKLFIKSLMFHIVLNCYQSNCGKIIIRISVPSQSFVDKIQPIWVEARNYIDQRIPEQARGNILIGQYTTEANALFRFLQEGLKTRNGYVSKYSAITDGGDGTYDFTINTFEKGHLHTSKPFSLRYAGQQIMTDSINVFYDHLVRRENGLHNENVKSIFKNLWVDKKDESKSNGQKGVKNDSTLDALVNQVVNYRGKSVELDHEKEKTLILMLIEQFGINYQILKNVRVKNFMDYINPVYQNFVRMIQYKFLFLFNILGEQIRQTVDLSQTIEQSFTIFLYGGTAQALAIAEPKCDGILRNYYANGSSLFMVSFIDAMMNLPRNRNGSKIQLKFLPASDTEKREIASGLILMKPSELSDFFTAGNEQTVDDSTSISEQIPFEMENHKESDNFFDSFGEGMFEEDNSNVFDDAFEEKQSIQYSDETEKINRRRPKTAEIFIGDLKKILASRKIVLKDGQGYSIDKFLPFLDSHGKPITLSQILDDEDVYNKISSELITMWTSTIEENIDIEDADLIYDIYTLKMVGFAIETYLRK